MAISDQVTAPGWYITRLVHDKVWPYVKLVLVGGPYDAAPKCQHGEEYRVVRWDGLRWHHN